MELIKKMIKNEDGQALSEYALLLGIIVLAVIVVLTTFKDNLVATFQKIADALKI